MRIIYLLCSNSRSSWVTKLKNEFLSTHRLATGQKSNIRVVGEDDFDWLKTGLITFKIEMWKKQVLETSFSGFEETEKQVFMLGPRSEFKPAITCNYTKSI